MSTFDDLKAIAHIEKAIREGRNPGAIWSEGQGDINRFIDRHSHEAFQDEIAKAKIRINPNDTNNYDVRNYRDRLDSREMKFRDNLNKFESEQKLEKHCKEREEYERNFKSRMDEVKIYDWEESEGDKRIKFLRTPKGQAQLKRENSVKNILQIVAILYLIASILIPFITAINIIIGFLCVMAGNPLVFGFWWKWLLKK